jgi:hypothetical protein
MCAVTLQAQDPIRILMDVPQEVVAGHEFMVNVEIEKGNLEEFSRFQQELPAGFTAIQENSGSADFSFDNQRVRFIWLKLPAQANLNISYRVKVHERLKGNLVLFGEFSYVEDNERKSIVIDQKTVRISPSPNVSAEAQVDIKDFASIMASEKADVASGIEVTAIRQTPYPSKTGNDIFVDILVYKKAMNKFAKIEETIPDGFEAKSLESRDGLFTFKDGVAKFVWMNLPDVPGFKVTYRLIPGPGKTINDLAITGVMSYIQEGRNIEVEIIQQDVDLSGVTDENVESMVAAISQGKTLPVAQAETEKVVEKTPVEKKPPPPPPAKDPVVKETQSTARTGTSRIPASQQLPVYDGVYFRVQLAAMKRFQDAEGTFSSYRLSRPVLVEQHRGLYKYSVGSFTTYSQAQAFKNSVLTRGISGAFIVAYRNGKRIDVMDALQATGGN